MKETNLEQVKGTAKALFLAVPIEPHPKYPFICQHPFTTNTYGMVLKDKIPQMVKYTEKEGYEYFKKQIFDLIDKAKKPFDILMLLNKAYYMTFLNYTEEFLSKEDLGTLLNTCWIHEEFPNRDKNITLKKSISLFKKASPNTLMDEEDLNTLNKLKAQTDEKGLTIYRGISGSGKENGLSWTTNKEKAEWFSKRFDCPNPRVLEKTIHDSKLILAYFDNRNEQEIILDTFRCKESS